MAERKALFMFRIVYFKPSGKYYTETTEAWSIRDCGTEGHKSALMPDAVAKIRGLRDSGSTLPGLSTTGWDGPILVDCPDGFPYLILPQVPDG